MELTQMATCHIPGYNWHLCHREARDEAEQEKGDAAVGSYFFFMLS